MSKKVSIYIFVKEIILMKSSELVKNKINRFAYGYVFTYKDFITLVNSPNTLKSILNRLVKQDAIETVSWGIVLVCF